MIIECALIRNGVVENIVVVDTEGTWLPPDGVEVIDVGPDCEIGGTWDGVTFTRPVHVPTPEQVREQTFLTDADRIELLNQLRTATAEQIKTYVTNNVTDLASAKELLTKIVLLLALAIRR